MNICPNKYQARESWRPSTVLRNRSANSTCCTGIILAEPPSNNQQALRLAEAQIQNLQLRHFDALTSKIYLNAKDAALVYKLASSNFTARLHVNAIPTCHIHGGGSPNQREILPHERTRILDSWYFLKLHAESLTPLGQQHHQSLNQELWAISALQAYVLWSMAVFVCERMDDTAQEVRISLPSFAFNVIVPSFICLSSSRNATRLNVSA